MKKKAIAMLLSVIFVLTLMAGLTGCADAGENMSASAPGKSAVCFVIANTACSQGLNLSSPLVQDTAYSTIRNYGYISVVSVDGDPSIVLANSYDIDEKYKKASLERLDIDARAKTTSLIAAMQSIIADDPEADYLEGLRLAIRSLSSLEGYDSKSIIVLGTGLSTVGDLDFSNNVLAAEPGVVAEMLAEKEAIPDFSGMTLYWQQLGDVALPQEPLTSAQRNRLQQIYGSIVEAGGGVFKYNDIMPIPVNEQAAYPSVTPVELPADMPVYFEAEATTYETEASVNPLEEPVVLSEERVTFIGDESEYLHPEEAIATIKPIAECLMKCDNINVVLCGTTAGDNQSEYTLALSKSRAEAVQNTLIQLGVNASRITAVGLGSDNPWHIRGVGTSGAAASSNRKVVLLDAASETAQGILNQTHP